MITIYYRNNPGEGKIIRPTPFVSISFNANRNKVSSLGGQYSITLNGIILANAGSPIALPDDAISNILSVGPNYDDDPNINPSNNYTRVSKEIIPYKDKAFSILKKQNSLRALFSHDGQKMEISPITGDEPVIICFPSLDSINFEEGTYSDICRYTISLTADVLYDQAMRPFKESYPTLNFEKDKFLTVDKFDSNDRNKFIYETEYIEDFSDTWAIEVDESFMQTIDDMPSSDGKTRSIPRSYRLSRNISATGKVSYDVTSIPEQRYEAWENARNFIKKKILDEDKPAKHNYISHPEISLASGLLSIPSGYLGYNHVRSENIDITAGSYSISDNWILTSGNNSTLESYDISLSSSSDSPIVSLSINGKIKGLSNTTVDNYNNNNNAYNKAFTEFLRLSNNNLYGINSPIFKRARIFTALTLNSSPAQTSVNVNPALGEIDYSVTFDNRPTTFFTDVIQENITINDTYPGDIYVLLPVLSRDNGPIFQFLGGKTQYERNISIELTMSPNYISKNKMQTKGHYLGRSPSRTIPAQLEQLITTLSPQTEPNIRKYFLNPITENWDPKTGKYSVSISWVYELTT